MNNPISGRHRPLVNQVVEDDLGPLSPVVVAVVLAVLEHHQRSRLVRGQLRGKIDPVIPLGSRKDLAVPEGCPGSIAREGRRPDERLRAESGRRSSVPPPAEDESNIDQKQKWLSNKIRHMVVFPCDGSCVQMASQNDNVYRRSLLLDNPLQPLNSCMRCNMAKCLSLWLVWGMVSCALAERHIHVAADATTGGGGSRQQQRAGVAMAAERKTSVYRRTWG